MSHTGSNTKSLNQYHMYGSNCSNQQMYAKQQQQHQNQMYYLNQQYHQYANNKSHGRYNHPNSRPHRKINQNNNNDDRHKFSEVQSSQQQHSTRGESNNQSQSESVSPFLSSSPLQTSLIFINKASLNPLHHPHHAATGHHIKSSGPNQTEQSLFSSSVSSLSSSSVSSSVVSSPSPSPSPPIGPFYMPLNSSEDNEVTDSSTEVNHRTYSIDPSKPNLFP